MFLFFLYLIKSFPIVCSIGWGKGGSRERKKSQESNTFAGDFLSGVNKGPVGWVSSSSQSLGYALSLPAWIHLVHSTSPRAPKMGEGKERPQRVTN